MYITFDVSLWKDNRPRIRYIVDFPGSTLTTLVQTCMMHVCMYVLCMHVRSCVLSTKVYVYLPHMNTMLFSSRAAEW